MALMQITVIPIGTDCPSVGKYVGQVVDLLELNGVVYSLNDMGTVIEDEPEKLLRLAGKLHDLSFKYDEVERVITQIVLDERRDKNVNLHDKCKSVLKGKSKYVEK